MEKASLERDLVLQQDDYRHQLFDYRHTIVMIQVYIVQNRSNT